MTAEWLTPNSSEIGTVPIFPNIFLDGKLVAAVGKLRSETAQDLERSVPGRLVLLISDIPNLNRLVTHEEIGKSLGYEGMPRESLLNYLRAVVHNARKEYFENENSSWNSHELVVKRGEGLMLLPENQYAFLQLPMLRVAQPPVLGERQEWQQPYLAVSQRFRKSAAGTLRHIVNPSEIKCLGKLVNAACKKSSGIVKLPSYEVSKLVGNSLAAGVEVEIFYYGDNQYELADMKMIK